MTTTKEPAKKVEQKVTKAPAKKAAKKVAKKAATKVVAKAEKNAAPQTGKKIRVTLVKGLRGTIEKHRACVRGLGLRHREHTVEVQDTPSVRGMINKVSFLVKVED